VTRRALLGALGVLAVFCGFWRRPRPEPLSGFIITDSSGRSVELTRREFDEGNGRHWSWLPAPWHRWRDPVIAPVSDDDF